MHLGFVNSMQPSAKQASAPIIDQGAPELREPSDLRLERAGFPGLLGDALRTEEGVGDGAIAGPVASTVQGNTVYKLTV